MVKETYGWVSLSPPRPAIPPESSSDLQYKLHSTKDVKCKKNMQYAQIARSLHKKHMNFVDYLIKKNPEDYNKPQTSSTIKASLSSIKRLGGQAIKSLELNVMCIRRSAQAILQDKVYFQTSRNRHENVSLSKDVDTECRYVDCSKSPLDVPITR